MLRPPESGGVAEGRLLLLGPRTLECRSEQEAARWAAALRPASAGASLLRTAYPLGRGLVRLPRGVLVRVYGGELLWEDNRGTWDGAQLACNGIVRGRFDGRVCSTLVVSVPLAAAQVMPPGRLLVVDAISLTASLAGFVPLPLLLLLAMVHPPD